MTRRIDLRLVLATWALLFLYFLALPAFGQTGDCAAETGTSTTWTITAGGTGQGFVSLRYDFYAAGLTGQVALNTTSSLGANVNAEDVANAFCENADVSREADEFVRARELIGAAEGPAELVIPAYPEVCPVAPAVPANNSPPGTTEDFCRMSTFHSVEVREAWSLSAEDHLEIFQRIAEWMRRTGPTGPGFTQNEQQAWLRANNATWNLMDFTQTQNTLESLVTGIATYETNFRRAWEDLP